jgi:ribulose-bisphosphate carboxylase large chain
MQRIVATYLIETPLAVEDAAASLAGEQSSGTFVAVPGGDRGTKAALCRPRGKNRPA